MSPRRRRTLLTTGLLAVLLLAAVAVSAQRFGGFGSFREGTFPTLWAPAAMPEASFTFCRLAYRSVRFEQSGIGWQTDYPYAEINLMTRLSELTKTRIGRDDSQTPRHYVVRLTDDTLFNCPFLMASDAGTVGFSDTEAERLRTYLMKGGVAPNAGFHHRALRGYGDDLRHGTHAFGLRTAFALPAVSCRRGALRASARPAVSPIALMPSPR